MLRATEACARSGHIKTVCWGAISTANTFTNRHRNTSTKEDNKPSASPPDTAPASTGTNSTPAHHGGTPTNRTHILAYNPGFACGSTTRSNGAVLRSGVIGQNLLPKWLTMAHSSKAKRLKSLEISRFRVERMTGVEPSHMRAYNRWYFNVSSRSLLS